jgi:hypothetical protein
MTRRLHDGCRAHGAERGILEALPLPQQLRLGLTLHGCYHALNNQTHSEPRGVFFVQCNVALNFFSDVRHAAIESNRGEHGASEVQGPAGSLRLAACARSAARQTGHKLIVVHACAVL